MTAMSIMGSALRALVERGASKYSVEELEAHLRESGEEVTGKLAAAADSPHNREVACHVIGIERWGQSRLTTCLGRPRVDDEYDGYRPAADSMATLTEEFREARRDTLAQIELLRQIDGLESRTCAHNDMGELSVKGWLSYLDSHATRELRRLK
jgi:hypothetical protein